MLLEYLGGSRFIQVCGDFLRATRTCIACFQQHACGSHAPSELLDTLWSSAALVSGKVPSDVLSLNRLASC